MPDLDPKNSSDSDGANKGKLSDNSGDNSTDPNIVNLQKKLTERDNEKKELEKKIQLLEKKGQKPSGKTSKVSETIEVLTKNVADLTERLNKTTQDSRVERFQDKYPEINPTIFRSFIKSGMEDEEIHKELTSLYQDFGKPLSTPSFTQAEAQDEIKKIKDDDKLSPVDKLTKISEIKNNVTEK